MLVLLPASRARAAEPVDADWRKALEAGNHVEARRLLEASSASPAELHAAMRLLCSGHFDSDLAEWLIGKGVELDRLSEQGGTLLHAAARHHDLAAITFLISRQVDANRRNTEGLTALDQLAFPGPVFAGVGGWVYPVARSNAFEQLLEATTSFVSPKPIDSILHRTVLLPFPDPTLRLISVGHPLNQTNEAGETALMVALRFDMGEQVKLLLAAGADPNVADQRGRTPLHERIITEPDEFVTSRRTIWGVASDLVPVVTKLVERKYRPPLRAFATNSYVALLLAHGADPSARDDAGRTPLHRLLSAERRFSPYQFPSSSVAFPVGRAPVPALLGTRSNRMGFASPAVGITSITNLVERLVDAGADVNARDQDGSTPLHILAKSNRSNHGDGAYNQETAALLSQLIHQLVAAGANLEARDLQGRTPLLLAVEAVPATTPIWVKAGAKVDMVDPAGDSALHRLVRTSFQDAVESLLRAGADPFERDRGGVTAFYVCYTNSALHHLAIGSMEPGRLPLGDAILQGRLEQVRWYLDLDRRFAVGRHHPEFTVATPLVMAVRNQQLDVARVLLANGADPNTPDEPLRSNQIAMLERPLADATRMEVESNTKMREQYLRMARESLSSRHLSTEFSPLKEAAYLYVLQKLDPGADPAPALEMVKLLLAHGARLNPAGESTVTPAQTLILQGQPELRRLFAGADDDPYEAALNGDVSLLAKLAAQDGRWLKPVPKGIAGVRSGDLGGLPEDLLLRVAARGHTAVVLFLLTNGVYAGPIKPLGHTPYFAAYTNAHTEVCEAIRERTDETDIFSPIWCFDAEWFDQIIAARPGLMNQPTDFGLLPVHAAAIAGNVPSLAKITELIADLNVPVKATLPPDPALQDVAFCSALHLAIHHDRLAAVRLLADRGAQLNRSYFQVGPPLARAVSSGNLAITRYLLERGAKPNFPFVIGGVWQTSLDCVGTRSASQTGDEMRQLLAEYGARTFNALVAEGHLKVE